MTRSSFLAVCPIVGGTCANGWTLRAASKRLAVRPRQGAPSSARTHAGRCGGGTIRRACVHRRSSAASPRPPVRIARRRELSGLRCRLRKRAASLTVPIRPPIGRASDTEARERPELANAMIEDAGRGDEAQQRRRDVESGVIPGGGVRGHVRPVDEVGGGHAKRLEDLRAHVLDIRRSASCADTSPSTR